MNNIMLCNNALFARVLKASTKSIFSLFVVLMLLSVNAQAQWSKMSLSATDIHSFAIDPSAPANMFAGTKCIGTGDGVCTAITGLYRSTNAGVNWTQVTSSLFSQKAVHVIAIAPDNTVNNKKMFISVENSGVFKSVDSGLNWTPAPIKPTGNPTFNLTQYVSQILVTNTIGSQQVTYAVVSSSSQYQNAGGIYATVNDGVTWNQIYIGDGIQ
ncbi:MAG: hypothetical protein OEX07_16120, partial [Gammaproteobacteria bacterium]|nr:hypothetical protein [Gammaproteobacteria bacterium]